MFFHVYAFGKVFTWQQLDFIKLLWTRIGRTIYAIERRFIVTLRKKNLSYSDSEMNSLTWLTITDYLIKELQMMLNCTG